MTNLPNRTVTSRSGFSAEISLYGGMVTSWRDPDGRDRLFSSSCAVREEGKAYRGGVPIVFPQFGAGALPSHGFARISHWQIVDEGVSNVGDPHITLELRSDARTRAMWPYEFVFRQTIRVGESLETECVIENHGEADFEFQIALHTYFSVGGIERVTVDGLQSCAHLDSVAGRVHVAASGSEVAFSGEVDRIYLDTPNVVRIVDAVAKRVISIEKSGFRDSVVWNPWVERSKAIADLGDEDYRSFVCVESGSIAHPVKLPPQGDFRGVQIIRFA